jgi:beta-ureidopropionase / N-carbamoyl-L-amino-acid hydrolase
MIGLATVIQTARSYAVGLGCVATVGKVNVVPGGVNAIPSHVTAWLDVRGRSEHVVHATVEAVASEASRLDATTTPESWTPTTTFDTDLVGRLRGVLPDAPLLGTGAGHDAGILATHGVPSAMLFVRNPTGVSHSPAELASTDDCHHGVTALTAVVTELCTGKDPESMSNAR